MPEISRFFGIVIYMYIDDHNPPHFHVWYNEYEAVITIEEGIVMGSLPRKELKLVYEWLDIHKEELLENWRLLSNSEMANKNRTFEIIMEDIILKIVKAEYVRDYILRLTFNNGEIRMMDFAPLMEKGVCKKLRDLDYFKSFTLDPFTVDWNNEIGFAPRFLYERSVLV